ncbi:FMN-dependent NADH-azoreductase [Listeria booriae]|uniref:FMN dependent NADH:quinone oxidoreductase n=1 Tax=Listeria booriae TaxID=1552123 RepID=A0A842DB97_9LIST|nr:FMN-dependent NADH-azoreductase [Listeria booriae]MBC1564553.1 FMN-dependent NADH-azoreductase [Listeria booriae]MBC1887093.1 FMN-dependent NADH-azoreductase [Listeria booriae]MBC1918002.1 FMN-dependent NADH-azoreductase [Listeria booriae]MBC1976026.1 FMN-dependent NADH-azoreductase [Listeria booriae]MBC1985025.1 FMN-dependent NADH-azoreductase [Listeria booriae]
MAKLLFIKASPLPDDVSRSMVVATAFLEKYQEENPDDVVERIDVYTHDIPMIDGAFMAAGNALREGKAFTDLDPEMQQKLTQFDALTQQFIDADKYVIVSPLWNLGIPPMLKAYFDTVVVAGKTFRYTETGPEGLLKGKKALQIHGSGGVYSTGESDLETHGEPYINTILNFIGIETLPSVFVEGVDYDPTRKDEILNAATEESIRRISLLK